MPGYGPERDNTASPAVGADCTTIQSEQSSVVRRGTCRVCSRGLYGPATFFCSLHIAGHAFRDSLIARLKGQQMLEEVWANAFGCTRSS